MTKTSLLSEHERHRLKALLKQVTGPDRPRSTVGSLLRDWALLVRKIETGYGDSIYEYENDLVARDRLQTLLDKAPEDIARELLLDVNPLDLRFEQATDPTRKPLRSNAIESWWQRVPKVLTGELKKDLAADRDKGRQ
jgi:hypothetical protein